jgi:hypothetical protein
LIKKKSHQSIRRGKENAGTRRRGDACIHQSTGRKQVDKELNAAATVAETDAHEREEDGKEYPQWISQRESAFLAGARDLEHRFADHNGEVTLHVIRY